jgi:hypothetical protein
MKAFVDKYADRIHGVLSCFDRMLFRGYLPIMSGWSMAQLLQRLTTTNKDAAGRPLENAGPGFNPLAQRRNTTPRCSRA